MSLPEGLVAYVIALKLPPYTEVPLLPPNIDIVREGLGKTDERVR